MAQITQFTRQLLHFRMARALLVFVLILTAVPALNAPASSETNALLQSWLSAQTNLQTWSATFVQTRRLASLADPLMATGRVWFARPNRFRWQMEQPAPTIAVRGPAELFVVYPNLKRAERYPLDHSQQGPWKDTLALLDAGFPADRSELESRFRLHSISLSNALCQVSLQPRSAAARKMMPMIRISFSTNDLMLQSTDLQFADGSTLRNEFTNGVVNPDLPATLFDPGIGPDFKVVEPLNQKRGRAYAPGGSP